MIVEMREMPLAQDAAGLAHLLEALDLLDADIEQADGRPLDVEQHARHGAAHDREIDEMRFVGADRGADIEHDRTRPCSVGHSAAIAGRSMPSIIFRLNRAIAISAPVLPAETATSASPFFTASMREPHRRFPAAVAQRLARLVVHPDGDVGVDEPGLGLERRQPIEQRLDHGAVAEQQEFGVGMPRQRDERRPARPPTAP